MPPFKPVSSSSSPPTSSKPVAEIQRSARLLADGKAAEAVRRLEALSVAVPAYAASQVLLAKAYEAEQRWGDALEAWHRAHFLVPGSPLVQRERRRLLEAKARAAEAASPPELPPAPSSEHPVDRGAEEVDGELAGEPGEQDKVAANEVAENEIAEDEVAEDEVAENEVAEDEVAENGMVEPVEKPVEEQAETMPDEALLDEALHDVAEPSDSEELPEALAEELPEALPEGGPEEALPEAIPEVFVDESAPVSDALGTKTAGSITDTPDGEAAWWKPSGVSPSETDVEGADTGWTVVSETETARTEGAVMEAQIVAPMDEAAQEARTETGYVADAHVAGAEAILADDLDSLIRELEDAPRIRPDANFVGEDELDGFDDEIADDMVSETLARIYVAQRQFGEAASVYETLADQHPEREEEFLEKAADVRARVGGGRDAYGGQRIVG